MGDNTRGLYQKFTVERTDGSSAPGGKHDGCEYFVLDLIHDKHAAPALRAYADSCAEEYPLLAEDLRVMYGDVVRTKWLLGTLPNFKVDRHCGRVRIRYTEEVSALAVAAATRIEERYADEEASSTLVRRSANELVNVLHGLIEKGRLYYDISLYAWLGVTPVEGTEED